MVGVFADEVTEREETLHGRRDGFDAAVGDAWALSSKNQSFRVLWTISKSFFFFFFLKWTTPLKYIWGLFYETSFAIVSMAVKVETEDNVDMTSLIGNEEEQYSS